MDQSLNSVNSNITELSIKLHQVSQYLELQDYAKAKEVLLEIITAIPNEPVSNHTLGQIYEFEGDLLQAANCYKKVLLSQKDNQLKYKIADLYEQSEAYEEAYEFYKELYNEDPQDKDICERLAHVSRILEKNDEAIEYYNKLLKNDPDNILALTQLSELYQENNNSLLYHLTKARIHELEEALSYAADSYKKAINEAENPEDIIQIRYKLAEIYIKREKYNKAIEEYLAILEHDPDNLKVHKELANVFLELDNRGAAIETLEKAMEIYQEDKEILTELSDLYIETEDYENAQKLLSRLAESYPEENEIKINLAQVYIELGMTQEALNNLNSVLEKDNKNIEAKGLMTDYYINTENFEKALELAESIKTQLPNSPFGYRKLAEVYEAQNNPFEAHYNYGIFHDLKGEKQLAIDEFTWALQHNPDSKEINMKIARLYEDISENHIAIEYYEKAFNIDNTDISPLKKSADLYLKMNEAENAATLFEKIIEIDDKNKDALLNLAKCYDNTRQYEKALEIYKKYYELAPLSSESDRIKARIDELEVKINGEEQEGLLDKILSFFTR